MKSNTSLMACCLVAMLAGCAPYPHTEAPLAGNFSTTKQMKLQAAHHWQVIADDMADTLADALTSSGKCGAAGQPCVSLYVEPGKPASAFGRAFNAQFTSRLVNRGLPLALSDDKDVRISVDAQTVRFSPDRRQYMGAGKFSLLTTGLWGLHQVGMDMSAATALLTASVAADVLEWNMSEFAKGATPRIELVLTASATRDGKYLARTTHVYYIADADASLYCWKAEGCGDTTVAGGARGTTLRVVGDCGPGYCTSDGSLPGVGGVK